LKFSTNMSASRSSGLWSSGLAVLPYWSHGVISRITSLARAKASSTLRHSRKRSIGLPSFASKTRLHECWRPFENHGTQKASPCVAKKLNLTGRYQGAYPNAIGIPVTLIIASIRCGVV
jgi:hypothetical protein